jgi:hypothetical protein
MGGADRRPLRAPAGGGQRRLVLLLSLGLALAMAMAGSVAVALAWSVVYLPVVGNGPAPVVPGVPPTDPGYYVTTTDPSVAYNLGCARGQADANLSPPANSLVVLDFGGQMGDINTTLLVNDQVTASASQITAIAEAFASGYWLCTGPGDPTSVLTLVLGTNNSLYGVDWTGGTAWGQLIASVAAQNQTNGYNSQVVIAGGNDMEPDWDSAPDTEAWVNGYAAATTAPLFNYGSADGCPTDSAATASCSNGWTQYDVWYVSWGALPAHALPEIYDSVNAGQWAMVGLYASQSQPGSGELLFSGPLDTYPLWNPSNTAAEAWAQLSEDLASNPATAQQMLYSVEMNNEN